MHSSVINSNNLDHSLEKNGWAVQRKCNSGLLTHRHCTTYISELWGSNTLTHWQKLPSTQILVTLIIFPKTIGGFFCRDLSQHIHTLTSSQFLLPGRFIDGSSLGQFNSGHSSQKLSYTTVIIFSRPILFGIVYNTYDYYQENVKAKL